MKGLLRWRGGAAGLEGCVRMAGLSSLCPKYASLDVYDDDGAKATAARTAASTTTFEGEVGFQLAPGWGRVCPAGEHVSQGNRHGLLAT